MILFSRRPIDLVPVAAWTIACILGPAASLVARPPNLIVVFADDLGYSDIGCFGATEIATPRLDQMALEGAMLTDFHVMAAVCTPSRAALLTGCYPQRVSLPNVLSPRHAIGLHPDEVTIAEILKSRGYATMCIGKWHLGHDASFLPTRQGFDAYFGIPYSNDMGRLRGTGELQPEGKNPPLPLLKDEQILEHEPDQSQLTARYTAEAIRFLTEHREQPFFLYLPHTFPHSPWAASDAFRGKSKHGLYGDMIEEIDWSTGEIVRALRELGLERDTLVVFTSDNGPAPRPEGTQCGSALPLRGGKFSAFEGGDRVPCLMWWPGTIPAGKSCAELVTAMDLLPTAARIAGADLPSDRTIDGHDVFPLLTGADETKSPYDFICIYRANRLAGVRCGSWRLYFDRKGAPLALYDLSRDIGETNNVAESHPEVVERLARLGRERAKQISKERRPVGAS